MAFTFSDDDIRKIASVLGAEPKHDERLHRFELHDAVSQRRMTLEIQTGVTLPAAMADAGPATLISIYAASSFLQLHACTGYIASAELGEVIFFARGSGSTSGLVVERQAGCSLYANVNDRLLSTDFTQLPPELIMSSVALSMTETLFSDLAENAGSEG